jgi:benzoate transport
VTTSPADLIANGKTSAFQLRAILICLLINMFDGFDVVIASYTAPVIAAQWKASPEWIGLFISASLLGMTAGSLILAPIADIVGRRLTIMGGVAIISVGMVASGLAQDAGQLMATRVVTGLGIGLLFASLTTMVVEYSTDKRRELAVSFFYLGYPIGATAGGLLTAYILESGGDWRMIYIVGGLAGLVMIFVIAMWLPESIAFLARRQPDGALQQINQSLTRMGRATIDSLPSIQNQEGAGSKLGSLFSPEQLRSTLGLWVSFGTCLLSVYFLIGWTPSVLTEAGLSTSQGVLGGVALNAGGGAGMMILGALASRYPLQRLIAGYFVAGAACMAVFGLLADSSAQLALLMTMIFVMGFFTYGALIGLYSLATRVYPISARATGVGWAIGMGRLGSIAGPSLAGALIGLGWERSAYFALLATPLLVGSVAVFFITISNKKSV